MKITKKLLRRALYEGQKKGIVRLGKFIGLPVYFMTIKQIIKEIDAIINR